MLPLLKKRRFSAPSFPAERNISPRGQVTTTRRALLCGAAKLSSRERWGETDRLVTVLGARATTRPQISSRQTPREPTATPSKPYPRAPSSTSLPLLLSHTGRWLFPLFQDATPWFFATLDFRLLSGSGASGARFWVSNIVIIMRSPKRWVLPVVLTTRAKPLL